jgi:hypothetical protein
MFTFVEEWHVHYTIACGLLLFFSPWNSMSYSFTLFLLKETPNFQIKMSFNNRKKRKQKEFGKNNKEFRHDIQ